MEKEVYTTGDIAKITGISDRTIKNYCTKGKIKSEKTPLTNYRRITYENLMAFMQENRIPLELLYKQKPVKTLIVDDNQAIIAFLGAAVKSIASNMIVETADDGYSACLKAGNLIPDIILLDVQMPGMNGIDVCRSIQSNPDTHHAKIIIMTGYATDAHLAGLNEFKIHKILLKPFGIAVLTETLRPLLFPAETRKGAHAF
ncbi:MAG: response regulator [Fibrobacterota bacterium]